MAEVHREPGDPRLREARRLAGLLEERKKDWVPRWRESALWIAPWRGRFDAGLNVGSDDAEKASWIPVNELDPRRMFEDHFFITKRMLSMRGN